MAAKKARSHAVKKGSSNKEAIQWLEQPVVAVLKDGSYYVGIMTGIEKDAVTLSAIHADKKLPDDLIDRKDKAQISGLLSALFGGMPNSGNPGTESPASNQEMPGLFGQILPHIRIGMNMLQTIMPLMGLFKI